jgi:hypothetical protein
VDTTQRAEFISDYAKVVVAAWHEPDFTSQLQADPAVVLASYGLTTQPSATFNIVRQPSGSGDIDIQVSAWERGETTGQYTLFLPSNEQAVQSVHIDTQDLESLRGQARGFAQAADTTVDACCCCCPCCTCT